MFAVITVVLGCLKIGYFVGFSDCLSPTEGVFPVTHAVHTLVQVQHAVRDAASVSQGVRNGAVRQREKTGPDRGCFSREALDLCSGRWGRSCSPGGVSRLTGRGQAFMQHPQLPRHHLLPNLEAPLWFSAPLPGPVPTRKGSASGDEEVRRAACHAEGGRPRVPQHSRPLHLSFRPLGCADIATVPTEAPSLIYSRLGVLSLGTRQGHHPVFQNPGKVKPGPVLYALSPGFL